MKQIFLIIFFLLPLKSIAHPDFTMKIQAEWLSKPLSKQSYFVTHIVTYYRTDEAIQSFNNFVKAQYFDAIMNKVILGSPPLLVTLSPRRVSGHPHRKYPC